MTLTSQKDSNFQDITCN